MTTEEIITKIKETFPDLLDGRPYGTFIQLEHVTTSKLSENGNNFDHNRSIFWGINQNDRYRRRGSFINGIVIVH